MSSWFRKIFIHRKQLLLALIVVVGIFLRTYHFGDWLRFNADQARDALLIRSAIQDIRNLPLLGPAAGGTDFKLGSIFYYFQYASGLIFGTDPEVFAYPDLAFSILTIILLFYIVRSQYSHGVALAISGIASVSFFMVRYGRFGWNPNSSAFFILLFLLSVQMLVTKSGKSRLIWIFLMGAAIGVGIQLHTFVLLSLPITALFAMAYLWKKGNLSRREVAMVFAVALIFNLSQITSELRNSFSNTKSFFTSAEKEGSDRSFLERSVMGASCVVRANAFILTSVGENEDCHNYLAGYRNNIFGIFFALVFSIGGFGLILASIFNGEVIFAKKIVWPCFLLQCIINFIIIIPVANQITLRYFLPLSFMPFFLLASWFEFLINKGKLIGKCCVVVASITLIVLNAQTLKLYAGKLAIMRLGGMDVCVLNQAKLLAEFIQDNSSGRETIYFSGDKGFVSRYDLPLTYLLSQKNIRLRQMKMNKLAGEAPIFYVRKKSGRYAEVTEVDGYPFAKTISGGKTQIFLLQ